MSDPFSNPAFMPHGHCFLWEPALLWLQVGTNLAIGLAYYSIPIALWVFVSRRRDLGELRVRGLFIMFSLFILLCGTSHFLDIVTIWKPIYWIDTLARALTAGISVATAAVLWPLLPQLLALPSPSQLRTINQSLESYAHITSHNLRAPAANIAQLLNLYEQAEGAVDQADALRMLKQSSARLIETLDILAENLEIRLNSGVERKPLTFAASLARVRELLAVQLLENEAVIEADFSACEGMEYPQDYLESILLNLISNALRYRSPARPPVVRLRSWKDHAGVHLSVADNGLGINLKRHGAKLFGLHKTFHRHPEARGVGLFLIKSQVESLGGRIEVQSEPDQGTRFEIVF